MQYTIEADHPSLPGHFPGHPVVPGVVLLSPALRALGAHVSPAKVGGIKRLKFLNQVLPGQSLRLEIGEAKADKVAFKIWVNDALAVDGQATLVSR